MEEADRLGMALADGQGAKVLERQQVIGMAMSVAEGNAEVIRDLIEWITVSPPQRIHDNWAELRSFQLFATRLIQNYLTSAVALLQLITFHRNRYWSDSDARSRFKEKKAADLRGEGLPTFMWRLRDYASHCGVVPVSTVWLRTTDSAMDTVLVALGRDELLEQPRFWKSGIGFLKRQRTDISVLPLIEQHETLLRSFCDWFVAEDERLNDHALREFRTTWREYEAALATQGVAPHGSWLELVRGVHGAPSARRPTELRPKA